MTPAVPKHVFRADHDLRFGWEERKQVEALVAKIAEEDEKEAKARADKQLERLGSKARIAMHSWHWRPQVFQIKNSGTTAIVVIIADAVFVL